MMRRLIAVLVVGMVAVFGLPYLFGEPGGTSESAMFGFSNRAALVAFLAFVAVFAVWTQGLGLRLPARSGDEPEGLGRGLLWWAALAAAGLATAVWLWARPGISFQEAPYFLDRLTMHGMGQRLYVDLDFPYGPLMFYLPLWCARLTGLSVVDSFYVTWVLQWFVGVAVLWKVVDLAVRGTGFRHGRAVFLLLWAVSVMDVLATGPNYTPLRYASGLLVAMWVWRLRQRAVLALVLAGIGCVVLLLYSAEQGIALALATVVFFALNWRRELVPGTTAFVVIVAAGLALAARLGELAMLRAVAAGALHMPLFFSVQNVAFLGLFLVACCAAWNAVRLRKTDDPLLYLVLVAGACLPGAFGQADTEHMFYNLLGAVLVGLLVLGQSQLPWRMVRIGFAVVFVGLGAVEHVFLDHAAITGAWRYQAAEAGETSLLRGGYVAVMAKSPDGVGGDGLHGFAAGTLVFAPFGVNEPAHPVAGGLRVFTGKYLWLLPLLNPQMTYAKIAELEAHPAVPLLIPDVTDGTECRYNSAALRKKKWETMLPFYVPPVRQVMTAGDPMCAYINANYRRLDESVDADGFAIWMRR